MGITLFPRGIPCSKRLFDLALTLPGFLLISPLLLLISLLLRVTEGRPIFFLQERPGYKGKIFRLYKFRTMRSRLDSQGRPLPDAQRLSPVGKVLRATSLDELPECINVIKGEMSLVGPRPLLVQYLDRYSLEQMRRHDTLPGITGWAQINGRNAISWEEKFRLDVWYVDHRTFRLDIKILFLTFWKAFRREGINQPGEATAAEFMGNQSENRE